MNSRSRPFKSIIYSLAAVLTWAILAPLLAFVLVVDKTLEHADVILVLAGSAAYVERTHAAALYYKKGVSNKILLTNDGGYAGWSGKEQRNLEFVELARRALVAEGVPIDAIEVLAQVVSGTIKEAEAVCTIAAVRNWKALLIVTSAYHTRRAHWTFERVFVNNNVGTEIGVVPATTGTQIRQTFFWWLTRDGWRNVSDEYVKSAYYYLHY